MMSAVIYDKIWTFLLENVSNQMLQLLILDTLAREKQFARIKHAD